jgi:hypothetical protein
VCAGGPLGLLIAGQVEYLFIIDDSDAQTIQKSQPAHYVDRKIIVAGEVNNRLPLKLSDGQSDLVPVSGKRARSGPDPLFHSLFSPQAEHFSILPLKDTKRAASVGLRLNEDLVIGT